MDLIGRTLGQYRIVEPIGAGGMATVYKAYQAGLDRYVAVKVLPPQHALTPGFKERFIREARAVAQLSHPNILPIYDFGIKDDISYFVMKYVPDHTLSHMMGHPMDLEQVYHFIDQIAGALDHAHERGIVHRDIKPSNMLLEGDWLLLADFGLAKIVEGSNVLTATGITLGTPAYVSPEQAEGKSIDHRSDIYSLGIVLYEMVTGRVPYEGETPAGVIIKHIIEPLPIPRIVNPDLPESVERVILKAVSKEPSERYSRAGELAEALNQAVSEASQDVLVPLEITEPLIAPELGSSPSIPGSALTADLEAPTMPPDLQPAPIPTPSRPTDRWAGRGGLILVGIGILLMAIVGAVLIFSNQSTSDEPAPRQEVVAKDEVDTPTRTPRPSSTAAIQPTATVVDQPTPEPTHSQVERINTPVPLSGSVITIEDVHQVQELARLGRGTINTLAVSPDGTVLAVAGSLGVWLYDVETFEIITLLEGQTKPVADIAWSLDSTGLAAVDKDGMVRIWDVASGDELRAFKGHVGPAASVAWSPGGAQLASGGWDNTVHIWDVNTGSEQRALTSHTEAVTGLAWSPDERLLASVSRDGTVRLWDVASGRETGMLEGHAKAVTDVAWSPDGSQLASASEDETVRIWLLASDSEGPPSIEERLVLVGHTSYVQSVAWSSDGAKLASGALDRTVRVWDVATGEEMYALKSHTKPVRGVSWLPGERKLVSGGDDGVVRMWDAAQGVELRSLTGHVDAVLSVAWSPDGTQLVSGNDDGTVRVWNVATGLQIQLLEGHKSEVNSVAWSPDGAQLASAGGALDNQVLLWDAVAGGAPRVLDGHSSAVTSVAWSPDGRELASAGWDSTVRLWDATGRLLQVLEGHADWVLSVSWSPDGSQLASGGKDGSVRMWNLETGGEQLGVLQGHTDQVTSVAWSPDGTQLATASRDKTLRIWDVASGKESLVLQTPGSMTSVAWSPDGTQLATVSEFRDNAVRIWDTVTGRELRALEGHVDYVKSVAWSPDGSRLATGSEDGTVRVWGISER